MRGHAPALVAAVVVVLGVCVVLGAIATPLAGLVHPESTSRVDSMSRSTDSLRDSGFPAEQEIAQSTSLTSDLFAANLTIEPGVTVQTNGYSIVISGAFDNQGVLVTGFAPGGPLPDSLGGSGGGAMSQNYCADDANGTSTTAQGGSLSCSNSANATSGTSAAAPALSSPEVGTWYAAGIQNYLAGGAGGAVQGYISAGAGANGLYIQAETIVPGTIEATGGSGQGTCSGIGLSGGGGGGAILLAYGVGLESVVNVSNSGGAAAPSCSGNVASGSGGNGLVLSLAFGSAPPVTAPSGSNGTEVISFSETLTSDLIAANLTIETGVVVTTDGFSILVNGTFDNLGTLVTGSSASGDLPQSLGGSGGGAQSHNYCVDDENGSSTLAPGGVLSCSNSQNGGSGGSPGATAVNESDVASWYAAGIQNYLSGVGGGAVVGYIPAGSGANGLYVQANTIIPGSIDAAGSAGRGTCSGVGLSGGGGGGAVILAYGRGVYGNLDLNATGGAGASSCIGNVASGAGGSGQLILLPYGTAPPVAPAYNASNDDPVTPGAPLGVHPPPGISPVFELAVLAAVVSAAAIAAVLLTRRAATSRGPPPTPRT